MTVMNSSIAFLAMIAGGICERDAIEWVALWENEKIAKAAIKHGPMSGEELVKLSNRWFVGENTLFFLLRHPDFPQEARSSLIRSGRGSLYIWNIHPGHFSEADIEAYLDYSSGWTFFRPEGLVKILQTSGMSDGLYRRAWHNFTRRFERTEIYGWVVPRFLLRKNEIRQCELYLKAFEKSEFLPEDVKREIRKQLKMIHAE